MLSAAALALSASILCLWLVKRLYYAYLSPLAKVPNAHFSTPFSRVWLLITKWRGYENRARLAAHQQLGPVVRIGPQELSINCVDKGIRTVYGVKFDKDAWYERAFLGEG